MVRIGAIVWTLYQSATGNKVCARSSSDFGLTWGSEEIVFTPSTPANPGQWNYYLTADAAGLPVVAVMLQDTVGIRIRMFRRESGSWVAKGTVTPASLEPSVRIHLFQHPTVPNSWLLTWIDTTASNPMRYSVSQNDMSTWGAPASIINMGTSGNTGGQSWLLMDSTGAIDGVCIVRTGAEAMWRVQLTSGWSGGTASITTTDISSSMGGPYSAGLGPRGIHLAWVPGTSDMRIIYRDYQSGARNDIIRTRLRTSGTWGGSDSNGYLDASYHDCRVMYYSATSWKIWSDMKNGGADTTHFSIKSSDKSTGSWVITEFLDEAKDQYGISILSDGSTSRLKAGDLIGYFNNNDNDWKVFVSSDLDSGTYPKTISQTIRFNQTLSLQGFIIRSVVASAVTRVQGGGRQIIKSAAGILWHVYYEGGAVKVAYSSDNGTTWTVTVVGPTWVPAGMAMCIGAGDAPALVLTRPSNDDFYIYLWNGTSWVLKKQLNEPIAESGSFQIMYTGSTYMMVYAYITSTSDRRVYSRTSADLVTWAAGVLVKNGDGSGTGPHVYRRVASCLDASGNVHAVYSIRSSSTHKLYYRKYSSGAWGTEELIATGYGGNNITDFHSGISIAVDDRGYVHVACRVRGTLYTGRVRIAYFQRTTAWGAVEYVHTDVDDDQDYPSLSLNLRTPVICWASASLGLNVTMAKRGSDASWTYFQITANARDSVQTVHGPGYGSSLNYTRGVVGSMRGSEEYFYSTDIISGNAAAMETTLNFTSILSTQRRVLTNTINFTSALSAVRSLTLRNTINFFSRLNFARTRAMTNNIDFTQHLDAGVNVQPITQTVHFTSTLSGVKSPTLDIHQSINFESRLNRVVSATMTNSIAFSGAFVVNVVKRQVFSQVINFTQSLTYNASLKKTMSGIINFIVGLVAMKADEGCQPGFTPERPLPASEDDVNIVYLIGPLPNLSLTVQLKRPEYGNSRRQALQVKVNRTRGGKLRPHSRTPTYEPQSITFESLSYLKLEQVRNFLRVCKGKKIYYIDEKNRKWIGYITTSDIDLAEEGRDRGGQFALEFEGILAS
jgi:hypothetical protein